MLRGFVAGAALLALAACSPPEQGPLMEPGQSCMSCHAANGVSSHTWTVAGTVFPSQTSSTENGLAGAEVLVTDSANRQLTLKANAAGNFYTAEPLTFPIHVEVQNNGKRMAMASSPPVGSCNACHTNPGANGAPGRIFVQ